MLFDIEGDFIFFDGATGTMLQRYGLNAGERPDIMNITNPEAVEDVQRMYAEAGSDILCTNTFGANSIALKGTGYTPADIISAAVEVTRRAGAGKAKVALDIGPLGELLEPMGGLSLNSAYALFKEQMTAGAAADLIAIETMSNLAELKAAVLAAVENTSLPVFATMTFDKTGRTFTGCLPESFALTAQRMGVTALGINCSLEPSEMYETAKRIAEMTDMPLIIKPNAGLPDGATGSYSISPAEFTCQMSKYAEIGAKVVGGCCGTSPEYIAELRKTFSKLTPGTVSKKPGRFICSPFHIESLDGFKPSGQSEVYRSAEAALDWVSEQDERIVELPIPQGLSTEDVLNLTVSAQELTVRPLLIISDDPQTLGAALRAVSGVAAVCFPGGETPELSAAASKYGAEILR